MKLETRIWIAPNISIEILAHCINSRGNRIYWQKYGVISNIFVGLL
jgi:hypothetical protein